MHDFLAECITKLEAIRIAAQRQIGPNFGVKQGLIKRFKLALKYSPLIELEPYIDIKALKPSVGRYSHSHPISQ